MGPWYIGFKKQDGGVLSDMVANGSMYSKKKRFFLPHPFEEYFFEKESPHIRCESK